MNKTAPPVSTKIPRSTEKNGNDQLNWKRSSIPKPLSNSSHQSKSSEVKRSSMGLSVQLKQQIRSSTQQTQLAANNKQIIRSVLHSAITFKVCGICTNSIQSSDLSTINNEQCKHTFCFDCLSQYCLYKINVNQQVDCPEDDCEVKLTPTSQMLHRLPEQIQKRFNKQVLWRQTIDNPNIKICPSQDCEEGVVDMILDQPKCRKCLKQFCKQCMMAKHEGLCDTNFQEVFKQWKRCPTCKIFIQKDQGCNHMTCNCGHQFCYVCLSNWSPQHYDCLEGAGLRLICQNETSLNPMIAIPLLFVFLLLFPVMITAIIAICLIGMALGAVIGAVALPFGLMEQLCPIWICILPFLILGGAIGGPFLVLGTMSPYLFRFINQYCNTVSFLKQQIFR